MKQKRTEENELLRVITNNFFLYSIKAIYSGIIIELLLVIKINIMRKIILIACGLFIISASIISCDVINSIPTNTTGGVFSLNGTWSLNSSTDNNAMAGSTISVLPIAGSGTYKTVQNNTYCVRENDDAWKTIKKNGSGGFTLTALVTACQGQTVYNNATITVINNDQITLTTRTSGGTELIQDWRRVKQQ